MNNLFLAHTPYHIILLSGICKNNHDNENNDLVIYEDFNTENIDIKNLKNNFDNVYIIEGNIKKNKNRSKFYKVLTQYNLMSNIKNLIDLKDYNRVYLCNDVYIQNQYLIDKISNKDKAEIIYIEDGSAAYTNNKVLHKLNIRNKLLSFIYKVSFENLDMLGSNSKINKRMFLWPKLIRDELKDGKATYELDKNIIESGIEVTYNKFFKKLNGRIEGIVILLEHIEFVNVFGNGKNESIKQYIDIMMYIIKALDESDKKIYLKYHPRDNSSYLNNYIKDLSNVNIIENDIASEILFKSKNISIISAYSTSILTASKIIGPNKIISIIKLLDIKDNNLIKVFENLKIELPESLNELNKIIKYF